MKKLFRNLHDYVGVHSVTRNSGNKCCSFWKQNLTENILCLWLSCYFATLDLFRRKVLSSGCDLDLSKFWVMEAENAVNPFIIEKAVLKIKNLPPRIENFYKCKRNDCINDEDSPPRVHLSFLPQKILVTALLWKLFVLAVLICIRSYRMSLASQLARFEIPTYGFFCANTFSICAATYRKIFTKNFFMHQRESSEFISSERYQ